MKVIDPIWYEGTLLMPQIFQQQEQAQQARLLALEKLSRINYWGVHRISIDEENLALKKLKLSDCAVYFQDGTWFDSQVMQYLPLARDLNQIPFSVHETTIYLCIPEFNPIGSNLSDTTTNTPLRFIKSFEQVTDLYGTHTTEVTAKQLNFFLKFDYEDKQNFLSIPILKLFKNQNNQWEIEKNFVPPVVFIHSSYFLLDLLEKQIQLLQNKSQRLALQRRERNQQSADFLVSDISLFWLLNILNQSLPELILLKAYPSLPPEDYYRILSRLVGALLSFSFELSVKDIPHYDPNDLNQTFLQLNELLLMLLDTVIPTALVSIDLERLGSTRWIGHLSDSRLDEEADYYLSVRANVPLYDLQDKFPKLCKIGSPDDVEKILPSASNGIPIRLMQRLPSALPMRSEAVYFALDKSNTNFQAMIRSRSCCIYTPSLFDGLNIELYVVPNEY